MKNFKTMEMATFFTFAILGCLLFFPIPEKNVTVFLAVAGPILGFFFGAAYEKDKKEGTTADIHKEPEDKPAEPTKAKKEEAAQPEVKKAVIDPSMVGALIFTLFLGMAAPSFAAETAAPVTGFGPSVVGSVGAFYFNGNYSLLNTGIFAGAAYAWSDKTDNVNSAGLYLGPHSQMIDGITSTSIDILAYLNLFQTSAGGFGIGVGTRFWQSGIGIDFRQENTFLAIGYKF